MGGDPLPTVEDIQAVLPHRPPFLLVDEIEDVEYGVRAVGRKCVTINEPFFQGHFPGYAVMPGVLIVEALAQVGAFALLGLPQNKGRIAFFAGIDNLRFKRQVRPGDTLRLEVTLDKMRGPVGKGTAIATVGGALVVKGELTFALGDRKE
jgi:3-hydroxyacyl-[acyl-carrier-protein] dehydratase